jgi:hypothetical protein
MLARGSGCPGVGACAASLDGTRGPVAIHRIAVCVPVASDREQAITYRSAVSTERAVPPAACGLARRAVGAAARLYRAAAGGGGSPAIAPSAYCPRETFQDDVMCLLWGEPVREVVTNSISKVRYSSWSRSYDDRAHKRHWHVSQSPSILRLLQPIFGAFLYLRQVPSLFSPRC